MGRAKRRGLMRELGIVSELYLFPTFDRFFFVMVAEFDMPSDN